MLYRKTWEKHRTSYKDVYTGWFLFGIIPLIVTRERFRRW